MRKQLLTITTVLGLAGAATAAPNGNGEPERQPTSGKVEGESPDGSERQPVGGNVGNDENNQEEACPPGTAPQMTPPTTTYQPPPQQQYYAPPPAAYPTQTTVVHKHEGRGQVALSFGGGVADFVRDRIRDNAGVAGGWDARLLIGAHSWIAFEAAYLGTAATANDIGSQPTLTTTQVFGDARVNLGTRSFQPFLFGGVGWANLHRHGDTAEAPIASQTFNKNDNTVVVPMGGGLAGYLGRHGTVDARFGYHLIADKDFTTTHARPDMWVAELRAGYVF